LPTTRSDDLLVAAEVGLARRHDLHLPALAFGVAAVHAQQVAGEQRRLVAAGAGADLEEQVALVVGVARQQGALQIGLQLGDAGLAGGEHRVRQCAHLGVGEQFARGGAVSLGLAVVG
jgi:hypothetical protein